MSFSGPTPGTPQDKIQELINRKLSAKIGSTPSPTVPCSFSGKKREFLTYASRRNTHSNFFESSGSSANGALQQTPTTPTAATITNSVGDPSLGSYPVQLSGTQAFPSPLNLSTKDRQNTLTPLASGHGSGMISNYSGPGSGLSNYNSGYGSGISNNNTTNGCGPSNNNSGPGCSASYNNSGLGCGPSNAGVCRDGKVNKSDNAGRNGSVSSKSAISAPRNVSLTKAKKSNNSRASSPLSRTQSPLGLSQSSAMTSRSQSPSIRVDSPIFYTNDNIKKPSSRVSDFSGYTVVTHKAEKITHAGVNNKTKSPAGKKKERKASTGGGKSKKSPPKNDFNAAAISNEKSVAFPTTAMTTAAGTNRALSGPGANVPFSIGAGTNVANSTGAGTNVAISSGAGTNVAISTGVGTNVAISNGAQANVAISIGAEINGKWGKSVPALQGYDSANYQNGGQADAIDMSSTAVMPQASIPSTSNGTAREVQAGHVERAKRASGEGTVRQTEVLDEISAVPPRPVGRQKKTSPKNAASAKSTTLNTNLPSATTKTNETNKNGSLESGQPMTKSVNQQQMSSETNRPGRGGGGGRGRGKEGAGRRKSSKANPSQGAAILRTANFGQSNPSMKTSDNQSKNLKSDSNVKRDPAFNSDSNIIDLDELFPDPLKQERSYSSLSTPYGVAPSSGFYPANTQPDSAPKPGESKVEVKVDLDDDDLFGGLESLLNDSSAPNDVSQTAGIVNDIPSSSSSTASSSVTDLENGLNALLVNSGPIIPDSIKASLSTFRFTEESLCPMCWRNGHKGKLIFCFTSLEEGVWMCSSDGCPFPIGLETELFSCAHDLQKLGPELRKQ